MQQIYLNDENIKGELSTLFKTNSIHRFLLVCDKFFLHKETYDIIRQCAKENHIEFCVFTDFEPNPQYESVVYGVDLFKAEQCDMIIAAGGGSALDVAKCIKLYSNMDKSKSYLEQCIVENDVKILALPTTAGTGSEATRYAVIYFEGEKQSVCHESCIPEYVWLAPAVLDSLPEYQRKATMLDAICHAIESYWSVNSTNESKEYAKQALELVQKNMKGYLSNIREGNEGMLLAANYAGKAINITQTTAAHAMCYKLTTKFGISHGHAAGLCLPKVWRFMYTHTENCVDKRGSEYLLKMFKEISEIIGFSEPLRAAQALEELMESLNLKAPVLEADKEKAIESLSKSVNPVRLKNNPVQMDENQLREIYNEIFI